MKKFLSAILLVALAFNAFAQEEKEKELTIWERYLKQFEDDEKPDLTPPMQMEHPSRTEKRKSR